MNFIVIALFQRSLFVFQTQCCGSFEELMSKCKDSNLPSLSMFCKKKFCTREKSPTRIELVWLVKTITTSLLILIRCLLSNMYTHTCLVTFISIKSFYQRYIKVSITIMSSRNEVLMSIVASTISIDSIATTMIEIMHIPSKLGLIIILFSHRFHPLP
ncbi:hypothetical protein M9H77_18553 [Catharanthus roseus]|uniref:Uncharacterized protein n=1 Tax=Catharanthus roseus TaxID=4058 RepID=A0ACC0B7T3_CATRO|nr:hypothetical protein M9H77_18553 [Catharanthus roseus]